MSLIVKLIVSLVIATIAFTLTSLLITGSVQLDGDGFGFKMLLGFYIATTVTALVVRDPAVTGSSTGSGHPEAQSASSEDDREWGQVKWFNVSKGFGFIVKDDGEEIFVHFRSIRGEGRRALKDGQRVSFVVAQSDKGPQAEDVEAET